MQPGVYVAAGRGAMCVSVPCMLRAQANGILAWGSGVMVEPNKSARPIVFMPSIVTLWLLCQAGACPTARCPSLPDPAIDPAQLPIFMHERVDTFCITTSTAMRMWSFAEEGSAGGFVCHITYQTPSLSFV